MKTNIQNVSNYVIITPARNEEAFIGKTINAVVSQTLKPLRWVIVNDGSTDKTKAIVESFLPAHDFIHLINIDRGGKTNFGAKAIAFRHGVDSVQALDYQFIGNLDADIFLKPDYYENVLSKFHEDPKLGIGGGIVYTTIGNKFCTSDETLDSVGGAVQLFRKACFEVVGGYPSLKFGGIDAAAEIKAKMLGWEVKKFPELKVYELRRTGSSQGKPLTAKAREGRRFHSLAYTTSFYFVRCLYRLKDKPPILGGLAAFYGFMESSLRRRPILLDPDVVAYLQNEQRKRLKRLLSEVLGIKS